MPVVSEEGDIGRGLSQPFSGIGNKVTCILTTSKLLTTGVDMPTCKNVVIVKVINSMTDFKQIIGRGTRVRDDYGKLSFTILDYTGSATRLFADPDFDGQPALITEEEINSQGEVISENETMPSAEDTKYIEDTIGFGDGQINDVGVDEGQLPRKNINY